MHDEAVVYIARSYSMAKHLIVAHYPHGYRSVYYEGERGNILRESKIGKAITKVIR